MDSSLKEKISELEIGDRILWSLCGAYEPLREGILEEISPSGKYVRISSVWRNVCNIVFREKLDRRR